MINQNQALIVLLKEGWTDGVRAWREVGTMKLPSRVSEIRRMGYQVESRKVEFTTRLGKKAYYYEYRIKEGA